MKFQNVSPHKIPSTRKCDQTLQNELFHHAIRAPCPFSKTNSSGHNRQRNTAVNQQPNESTKATVESHCLSHLNAQLSSGRGKGDNICGTLSNSQLRFSSTTNTDNYAARVDGCTVPFKEQLFESFQQRFDLDDANTQ
jgi:hypothetical protein